MPRSRYMKKGTGPKTGRKQDAVSVTALAVAIRNHGLAKLHSDLAVERMEAALNRGLSPAERHAFKRAHIIAQDAKGEHKQDGIKRQAAGRQARLIGLGLFPHATNGKGKAAPRDMKPAALEQNTGHHDWLQKVRRDSHLPKPEYTQRTEDGKIRRKRYTDDIEDLGFFPAKPGAEPNPNRLHNYRTGGTMRPVDKVSYRSQFEGYKAPVNHRFRLGRK